jgi:hypothetical protein
LIIIEEDFMKLTPSPVAAAESNGSSIAYRLRKGV